MKELEVIQTAIQNITNNLNIQVHWQPGNTLDGTIEIQWEGKMLKFHTEIKQELRMHQLNQLVELKQTQPNLMVVAQHIYAKEKEQLRKMNIPYLEANGNIYIKDKNIWIWIDNNKTTLSSKGKGNRAFTKTGLKVLFQLLLNKELVNQPHREIAKVAAVGLGNIPQIINGLKETGYLQKLDKNTYLWSNRGQLLDRWITEYNTTLKPQLQKGTYKLKDYNTKQIFKPGKTVWGGEPAADILTNYLRPEKFILYTTESQIDLMKNYKLVPNPTGELRAYELFWNQDPKELTAPPLLIYADLILEGGKRNNETAQLIFNEHIKPNL